VIGVAVMIVHDVLAEQMVGERVAALLIVGHQTCSLQRRNVRMRGVRASRVIAWTIEHGQKRKPIERDRLQPQRVLIVLRA
jgi:hypothetical protein